MNVSIFEDFKGKLVDDVIDDIKRIHTTGVRITYPKGMLTADYQESRLNINCDVHGYIKDFSFG